MEILFFILSFPIKEGLGQAARFFDDWWVAGWGAVE
jgi:hypothetical protein